MAIDTSIPRTRRALLAGGLGGLAAVVASALGRPLPVRAGIDGDVVLGQGNTATTTTAVSNFTTTSTAFAANCSNGHALSGTTSGSGRAGVYGASNLLAGSGVRGRNAPGTTDGYLGTSISGVLGESDAQDGVRGDSKSGLGVYGTSDSSCGVLGISLSHDGVEGRSDTGNGVYGVSWSTSMAATAGRSIGSSSGIYGYSGRDQMPAAPAKTGVYGRADQDANAHGVHGESTVGTGVLGASYSGSGIAGTSQMGAGVAGNSSSAPGVVGSSMTFAGVSGQSSGGIGVFGFNQILGKPAVLGHSNAGGTGVLGFSGAGMPPAPPAKTGVYGYAAQDASSRGVYGQTTAGEGVRGQATKGNGVVGYSDAGVGVAGGSASSFGVMGSSSVRAGVVGASTAASEPAIIGQSAGHGTGVLGFSGGASGGLPAAPDRTGVYGYATQDATARGVWGATTVGRGVQGEATSGIGGYFSATTGTALRAIGRVKLDKCAGVATIPAGASSVTVTPGIDLVSTSAVVATLQGSAGSPTTTVSRCYVNATTNKLTIYLTKAATQQVKVAWHVFG